MLSFQEGFVAAIDAGHGLAAALHTPRRAREHIDDARLLMICNRHDFADGPWPAALRDGVRAQAARIRACVNQFAVRTFGRAGQAARRRAPFVPCKPMVAAVKGSLERRENPPAWVDERVTVAYLATARTGCRGRD